MKPGRLVGKKGERDRILDAHELALVWRASDDLPSPYNVLIKLLLLLGNRRSELARAEWGEFALERAEWTLPAHRAKNGIARAIPLPPMAVELLNSLPRIDDGRFVFAGRGGTAPIGDFANVKRVLDAHVAELNGGAIEAWVLHDCRRTCRSGLSAVGTAHHVAELCIGDQQRGVHRIYDRHAYLDEQRTAFEKWSARLVAITADKGDNVVALRA